MKRRTPVRIDFWYDRDCPNAPIVRARLRRCLAVRRAHWKVHEHRDAGRLSPSVIIEGADVVAARAPQTGCRLDLPTSWDIDRALRRAEEAGSCAWAVVGDADRLGRAARTVPGIVLIIASLWWAGIGWWDVGLALLVLPVVAQLGAHLARSIGARRLASVAVVLVVTATWVALTFVTPANGSGGMLLFLGVSLVIAAVRGFGGCEVLAIGNVVLRRRESIWCPVFSPLDRSLPRRASSVEQHPAIESPEVHQYETATSTRF